MNIEAYFYVTRRCDLRCTYCSVPIGAKGEIPVDVFIARLERLCKLGLEEVILGGGEPFLHPRLEQLVSACIEREVYPILLTNGRLLVTTLRHQRRLARMIESGLENLSFSIDTLQGSQDALPEELKSSYAIDAIPMVEGMGITDIHITTVLRDDKPTEAVDVIREYGYRYPVHISYLQTGEGEFQRGERPKEGADFKLVIEWIIDNYFKYKIANPLEYFKKLLDSTHKDWHCTKPGYFVIAPTGEYWLCQNIKGTLLPLMTHFTEFNHYASAWRTDLKTHCPGCFINCAFDFHDKRE